MQESDISIFSASHYTNLDPNEDLPPNPSTTQDQDQDSADVKLFQACKINSNSGQIKALKVCVKHTVDILETMRQDSAVHWQASHRQNKNIRRAFKEIKDLRKETNSKLQNLSQVVNVLEESHREDRNSIDDLKKMQEKMKNELNDFRQRASERFQCMEENQSKFNDETGTRLVNNELQFDALKHEIDTRIKAMEGDLKRKIPINEDSIQNNVVPVEIEVVDLTKKKKGRLSSQSLDKVNHYHSNAQVIQPSSSKTSIISATTANTTAPNSVSLSSVPISNSPGAIQSSTMHTVTNKPDQSISNRPECPKCKKTYSETYLPRHIFICKGTNSKTRSQSTGKQNMNAIAETDSEQLPPASGKSKAGRVLRPRKNK